MTGPSVVENIFLAALEKGTPEERAGFLNEACKDDADLRRRVERLLAAHPQVGSFMEKPAAGAEPETTPPTGAQAGAVIAGRYKLLQPIGEGGMGSVWMAQQTSPVTRLVAVKLIKAGMDSSAVLARFEAERQALAVMDHPNIAKVLDGGDSSGRPFFVMELVKGTPITRYCDEHRLPLRQRLELFVCVCQALQHAHQKGIVHRDLKPSNVLVAPYDGRPVPKVIDFGVAKATGQRLTERTLFTEFGAIIGTLQYMSPEQAEVNNLDIDTRSDIYSLGVLLYELLTGTTPLDMNRLRGAAMAAVLMAIHDEEPPKPSTRLTQSTDSLPSIAAQRQSEPAKLSKLMRGELDWIVMKALEKDRNRRYESANGLARDLERYLHDEVVEAKPASAGYRLRKFARKHRMLLTTAAAFAALLLASAALTSWLALKSREAEAIAEEKRKEAEANAEEAKKNAEWAERNAGALSETSNQLLITVIDADIRNLGLKVDIDLAELRTDSRVGLLRLARPLQHTSGPVPSFGPNYKGTGTLNHSGNPKFVELREFVTMAVLATGQRFTNLVPPIPLDGSQVVYSFLGSDARRTLTLEKNDTARLWDARTGRLIALLRRGDERVLSCGFSSDGTTVHTDSPDGAVRLWDANDGAFRAETEARPGRIQSGGALTAAACLARIPTQVSRDRILTLAVTVDPEDFRKDTRRGPAELWDARTGKLVARLSRPGLDLEQIEFIADDKYIATVEGKTTIAILSAEDGRLLESFSHPAGELVSRFYVSPRGRRIITHCEIENKKSHFRVWQQEGGWRSPELITNGDAFFPIFLSDDVVLLSDDVVLRTVGTGRGRLLVFSKDGSKPKTFPLPEPGEVSNRPIFSTSPIYEVSGNCVRANYRLVDTLTGNLLPPPAGRRYHPDLVGFAPDGRFVVGGHALGHSLLDTRTEKEIDLRFGNVSFTPVLVNSPVGRHWIIQVSQCDLKMLPPSGTVIAPELLELWAQVVVGGELDATNQFVKWDEPTWEKKRQELAAKPAPYPDFPFPGYVATDRLHWLRQEYENASDADKPRLAKQLLDRAEAIGDKIEAVRWRTNLTPAPAKPAAK